MSEQERVQILREILDTTLFGMPAIWYVAAISVASLAAMAWIIMDGRRTPKLNRNVEPENKL